MKKQNTSSSTHPQPHTLVMVTVAAHPLQGSCAYVQDRMLLQGQVQGMFLVTLNQQESSYRCVFNAVWTSMKGLWISEF